MATLEDLSLLGRSQRNWYSDYSNCYHGHCTWDISSVYTYIANLHSELLNRIIIVVASYYITLPFP